MTEVRVIVAGSALPVRIPSMGPQGPTGDVTPAAVAARDDAQAAAIAAAGAAIQTAADRVAVATDAGQAASDAAAAISARADAVAAAVVVASATWAGLSALMGTFAGQRAQVYGDVGTHTDPIVGGTVANAGVYGWSVDPAGWRWLSVNVDFVPATDDEARAGENAWKGVVASNLKARFANMLATDIPAEYGYVHAWIDKVGRFLGGFKTSGRLVAKLDDDAYVPLGALDSGVAARLIPAGTTGAEVLSRVNPAGVIWREFDPLSGFVYGITDAAGRLVLGITPEGHLRARIADAAKVPSAALEPSVLSRINPAGVSWKAVPADSGYIFAAVDANDRILFGVTPEGRFRARLAPGVGVTADDLDTLVASAVAAQNLFPSLDIACWGDSMTAGAGGSGTTYPGVLATLLPGRSVTNLGVGGQVSMQIAARQGGRPIQLSVTDDTIPASGDVQITSRNINPLYNSGSYTGSMVGSLAGVPGTLSSTTAVLEADAVWTFTRTQSGSAVSCPPNTVFIPDAAVQNEAKTVLIWSGRNGAGLNSNIRDDILSMVDRLTPREKRALVFSICNGTGEGTGTSAYNSIAKTNAELQRYFGDRFVDVRRYLIDFGLTEAGITPTTQDTADVAADTIPASLRSDNVHFTAAGYTVVANFVCRILRSRGWV